MLEEHQALLINALISQSTFIPCGKYDLNQIQYVSNLDTPCLAEPPRHGEMNQSIASWVLLMKDFSLLFN